MGCKRMRMPKKIVSKIWLCQLQNRKVNFAFNQFVLISGVAFYNKDAESKILLIRHLYYRMECIK